MCGAPDNRATQMSLTLTLSRQRERELERRGNWKEEGNQDCLISSNISSNRRVAPHPAASASPTRGSAKPTVGFASGSFPSPHLPLIPSSRRPRPAPLDYLR